MTIDLVDLYIVSEILGSGWSIDRIIETICESRLPAYVKYECNTDDNTNINDNDCNKNHENPRIISITKANTEQSGWYWVRYEEIECSDKLKSDNKKLIYIEDICMFRSDVIKFIQKLDEHANELSGPDNSSPIDIKLHVKELRERKLNDNQVVNELMINFGKSGKYSKPNLVKFSALEIGITVFPNQAHATVKEKDALEAKVWRIIRENHAK